MPEQIERILKEIHILFSKCDMYQNQPDKIILNKREMFNLLEKLNYAVIAVMDQYEATTRSKEKAKEQMEQMGQKIVDEATEKAEDVYAASMLYTDGALNDLYCMIEDTQKSIQNEYAEIEEKAAKQLETIRENQEELMMQLKSLSQGKKYLEIIDEFNAAYEEELAAAKTEAQVATAVKKKPKKKKKPSAKPTGETGNAGDEGGYSAEKDNDADDIDNAEDTENTEDTENAENIDDTEDENGENANVRDNNAGPRNTVRKQSISRRIRRPEPEPVDEEEVYDDEPVRQKIEVRVNSNPAGNNVFNASLKTKKDQKKEERKIKTDIQHDKQTDTNGNPSEYKAEDFNLDAEYEQWKDTNDETDNENNTGNDVTTKIKGFFFGKHK